MITMLSGLYVDNDQARPIKTCTDKAYGHSWHFWPLHTDLKFKLMAPPERAAVEEEDKKNKGPRMSVELLFNNIVRN